MKCFALTLLLLCVSAAGAQITLSGGARVSTGVPATGQQLQLTPPACGNGQVTTPPTAYSCQFVATGGVPPYTWSIPSGTPPTGLTLNPTTGLLSGTLTAAATYTFTIQVADSSPTQGPPQSAPVSITVTVAGACGPPLYPCGRQDYNAIQVNANTTVPPAVGSATPNGPLLTCTPGMAGQLASCGALYGTNVQFTDPNFPGSQLVRISDYSDVLNVPTGCAGTACTYTGCQVSTAPGGDAGHVWIDVSDSYIILSCGGNRIKWFNPSTMQVNTSLEPHGWVICGSPGPPAAQCKGTPPVWVAPGNARFAFTHAGLVYNWSSTVQQYYQITNGTVGPPVQNADYAFSVPCWSVSTMSSTPGGCADWQPNHAYPAGANIMPVNNVCGPGVTPPCTCPSGMATGTPVNPCAGPHEWQLLNGAACTSGPTEPDFSVAWMRPGFKITNSQRTANVATYTFVPHGAVVRQLAVGNAVWITGSTNGLDQCQSTTQVCNGNIVGNTGAIITSITGNQFTVASTGPDIALATEPANMQTFAGGPDTAQWVIAGDGTCNWADMWVPLSQPGGKQTWQPGTRSSYQDLVWSWGGSNSGGQDSKGACFGAVYDAGINRYSHANSCTGNVYNTTCNAPGTGWNCNGGTFTQVYVGNLFKDNAPYSVGSDALSVQHGYYLMKGGTVLNGYAFPNNCAFTDSVAWYQCTGATSPGHSVQNAGYWLVGSNKVSFARDFQGNGAATAGALGHGTQGMYTTTMSNFGIQYSTTLPNRFPYRFFTDTPFSPFACTVATPCVPTPYVATAQRPGVWDYSFHTCSPNPCLVPPVANPTSATLYGAFALDLHDTWVNADVNDSNAVCGGQYPFGIKSNTNIAPAGIGGINNSMWPPQYPWEGEIDCYSVTGTKEISRQAYFWGTGVIPIFSTQENIGEGGPSGNFWAFSSDWWCTLGTQVQGATPICGFPYRPSTQYNVGDLMGTVLYYSNVGQVYKTVTAGSTDATPVPVSTFQTSGCTTVGQTCVLPGTATFQYMGLANMNTAAFVVRLR